MFNIRQGPLKSPREYLFHFSEATIRVIHTNQEMFVEAFLSGVKAGYFNDSLTQRPTSSLLEVVPRGNAI